MMGRLSLPIYLWHVLPLFLLKGFDVHQSQPALYYLLSMVACGSTVWLVKHGEHKWRVTDRWFYGVPTSPTAAATSI
jgi:peptidoglycan/LPS O-acetylase OafA/YrhL